MGGLPEQVSQSQIEQRFKSMNIAVQGVSIMKNAFDTCRGFAYIDVVCSKESLAKCMSVYNGSIWLEGKRLKLEKAKPDYLHKQKKDDPKSILKSVDVGNTEKRSHSKKLKIKTSARKIVYFRPKKHMHFDDCDEATMGEGRKNLIMDFMFTTQAPEQMVYYSSVSLTESNSHLRRQYTAFHKQACSTPQ